MDIFLRLNWENTKNGAAFKNKQRETRDAKNDYAFFLSASWASAVTASLMLSHSRIL